MRGIHSLYAGEMEIVVDGDRVPSGVLANIPHLFDDDGNLSLLLISVCIYCVLGSSLDVDLFRYPDPVYLSL